jgi:hypothetical protein
MKYLFRFIFLMVLLMVFWQGYLILQKRHGAELLQQYLPRLEQELIRGYAADYGNLFCVAAPHFPVGDGLPKTEWVRSPNGLSECRVTGEHRLPGGLKTGCAMCPILLKMGLIEQAEMTFRDADDQAVTRPVYRLTEAGHPLYFSEMTTRRPLVARGCEPREKRYVPEDEAKAPVPKEGEIGGGFCFAEGLRLHAIRKYQTPVRSGNEILMGVEYDVEVINPAPALFDPEMSNLLHDIPARGNPALLPPVIGTATFKADSDEPTVFHNEVSIDGPWISK